MEEPGPDRRDWETEWQALEPLVVDSPEESLPELDELVGRMLVERGYPTNEEAALTSPAEEEDVDPDALAAFRVAHEIACRAARNEVVEPGDVAHAVGLFRELYEHFLGRPSPRS